MSDALTLNGGRWVTAFRSEETATADLVWQCVADRFEFTAPVPWEAAVAVGDDAFSAPVDGRKQLEGRGWLLAINGARRDTYPSGMGRAAGGRWSCGVRAPAR